MSHRSKFAGSCVFWQNVWAFPPQPKFVTFQKTLQFSQNMLWGLIASWHQNTLAFLNPPISFSSLPRYLGTGQTCPTQAGAKQGSWSWCRNSNSNDVQPCLWVCCFTLKGIWCPFRLFWAEIPTQVSPVETSPCFWADISPEHQPQTPLVAIVQSVSPSVCFCAVCFQERFGPCHVYSALQQVSWMHITPIAPLYMPKDSSILWFLIGKHIWKSSGTISARAGPAFFLV